MNVLLSLPLVRALSLIFLISWGCIVLHTRGMRSVSAGALQGKTRENGQRGTFQHGLGVTSDRRLRALGNGAKGSLSTGSLVGHLSFL